MNVLLCFLASGSCSEAGKLGLENITAWHSPFVLVWSSCREKRQVEFETYLRRMMKRFNKGVHEDTHKVIRLNSNVLEEGRHCRAQEFSFHSVTLFWHLAEEFIGNPGTLVFPNSNSACCYKDKSNIDTPSHSREAGT